MITVRFLRVYKGFGYEVEMEFADLKTVESLGPIIRQVERFIDGTLMNLTDAEMLAKQDVVLRGTLDLEKQDQQEEHKDE